MRGNVFLNMASGVIKLPMLPIAFGRCCSVLQSVVPRSWCRLGCMDGSGIRWENRWPKKGRQFVSAVPNNALQPASAERWRYA